jgi:predicted nucleic acid-binding protein
MPGRDFVDTNVWLYALVDPGGSADKDKQRRASGFVGLLARPVINSQVIREHR